MRPLLALAVLLAAAAPAAANTVGSWSDPVLVNRSSLTIVQVRTNEGGGWSEDWLGGAIVPAGGSLALQFNGHRGLCDVEIAVVASDYTERRYPVSLCGIGRITLTDETALWE